MTDLRVDRPMTPCFCSVCDKAMSIKVTLDNPKSCQPATFALCDEHADTLANLLMSETRRLVRRAPSPAGLRKER